LFIFFVLSFRFSNLFEKLKNKNKNKHFDLENEKLKNKLNGLTNKVLMNNCEDKILSTENENFVLNMQLDVLDKDKYKMRKFDLKIINEKDKTKFLEILDIYIQSHFKNKNENIFPKIIHQIWIGDCPTPYNWIKTWSEKYIESHPNWTHMLWDDEQLNYFDMINQDIYHLEKSFNGKSDIARYEILYRYGGIYIDADSIWLESKSFDNLFNEVIDNKTRFFTGVEPDKDYVASGVVGSTKGHPNLLLLINAIRRNFKYSPDNLPWITMGPIVHHVIENNNIPNTRYPSKYFYPEDWKNKYFLNISDEKKEQYKYDSYMYNWIHNK